MKKCINCGAEMDDSAEKCAVCGVDQKGIVVRTEEEVKPAKLNVLSIVGFVFTLITAAIFAFFAAEIAVTDNIGVIALLIVGIIAYGASGVVSFALSLGGLIWAIKAKHRGKGFAIAALAILAVTLIVLIVFACISNSQPQE